MFSLKQISEQFDTIPSPNKRDFVKSSGRHSFNVEGKLELT